MSEPSSPTGVEAPPAAVVVVSDEQAEVAVDAARWGRLAEAVLHDAGRAGELTLTFVDRHEIAALNVEHLGHEGPTDVLSFPLDAADPAVAGAPAVGPVLLGDVVVCPAVARDAAPDHAGTLDDELALLAVHGVLHVLGHDHAEPDAAAAMRARELDLLRRFHWHGREPDGFHQQHCDTAPSEHDENDENEEAGA